MRTVTGSDFSETVRIDYVTRSNKTKYHFYHSGTILSNSSYRLRFFWSGKCLSTVTCRPNQLSLSFSNDLIFFSLLRLNIWALCVILNCIDWILINKKLTVNSLFNGKNIKYIFCPEGFWNALAEVKFLSPVPFSVLLCNKQTRTQFFLHNFLWITFIINPRLCGMSVQKGLIYRLLLSY